MKTIDILTGEVGETVTISTTGNDDVIAYRICVDRWKGTPKQIENWPGSAGEGTGGVSFAMTPADGYDITIKASVKAKAQPSIDVRLDLGATGVFKYSVKFPSAEGPVVTRDWNIFFDEATS